MRTLREAMIVFRYQTTLLLREPVWIIMGLVQPLLYLALFGPLLEPLSKSSGFTPFAVRYLPAAEAALIEPAGEM